MLKSYFSHLKKIFDLRKLYDRTKMFKEGNIFKKNNKLSVVRYAGSLNSKNKRLYLSLSLHYVCRVIAKNQGTPTKGKLS